ncbi:hypothetical protein Dimus_013983 [Dionaea muscipula]
MVLVVCELVAGVGLLPPLLRFRFDLVVMFGVQTNQLKIEDKRKRSLKQRFAIANGSRRSDPILGGRLLEEGFVKSQGLHAELITSLAALLPPKRNLSLLALDVSGQVQTDDFLFVKLTLYH